MSRQLKGYAAPMTFGPWLTVASHGGSITYTIEYEPVGDTVLVAEVRYFKGAGPGTQVTEGLLSGGSITTSNSYANVEVQFKGIVLGSVVDVTVTP